MTIGTACGSKAYSFSSASSRMAGYRFPALPPSSKSSSPGACTPATALSRSSMRLVNWTARLACWSGKPPLPDIRKSLLASFALDPQLICYSWIIGIETVAQTVFVRKRVVEVQHLRATISDEQRSDFEALIEDAVRRIESRSFLPQSGTVSPRTRAHPVLSSGCVLISESWSIAACCANRECTLVCLTSLFTSHHGTTDS